MSTTSVHKCAERTSNIEEMRGVEIKSVRNYQDVCSKNKIGRPTYLNSDEEALVVELEEIEGAHGFSIGVNKLGAELQLVIKSVSTRQSTKDITTNLSSKYTRSVIKQVDCK